MPLHASFTIYPAIDLRQGKVVRLRQGDPKRQTIYSDDPAAAAWRWIEAGARWLHVVNLDGAFGEKATANQRALQSILSAAAGAPWPVQVQFGGGLRSAQDIENVLQAGVQRALLGTLAIEKPELAAQVLERFGAERIGLAMDVRSQEGQNSAIQVHGWQQSAALDPIRVGRGFYALGLRICVYTEVSRDGGGGGIDLPATQHFAQESGLQVIASGGAASLDDISSARRSGLSGIILGRALYEGVIELRAALQAASQEAAPC